MSNPGDLQNPYGQPVFQPPAGHPQQAMRPAPDRSVVRQVLFGAVVVVGISIVSNILSTIGNAAYGLRLDQATGLIWGILLAVVFVAGAVLSSLYIAPLGRATSTPDLLKRLAIAAVVGSGTLLVLNFIWSVVTGGQYLMQIIVSSGIFGSLSMGLTNGAFFALGVFVARALPAAPGPYSPGQAYGSVPPQG